MTQLSACRCHQRCVPGSECLPTMKLSCLWHTEFTSADISQVFKLAILTAQRIGEVAGMTRSELDIVCPRMAPARRPERRTEGHSRPTERYGARNCRQCHGRM